MKEDDYLAKPRFKSKLVDDYKYDCGEEVYYIGGLFEKYMGLKGIVKRRKRQRNINHYQVWFEDLQVDREFMEKFLKNKNELEEVKSENN